MDFNWSDRLPTAILVTPMLQLSLGFTPNCAEPRHGLSLASGAEKRPRRHWLSPKAPFSVGKWGANPPLGQRWGGFADRCIRCKGIIWAIGKTAHAVNLGAHGSVGGAGAAMGGRATCQPCLCGAARPVPGAQTGSPVHLAAPWLPFRAAIWSPLNLFKSHLGWDADVGCEPS